MTAAYIFVDMEKNYIRYAGAGHPPLLLWRASTGTASEGLENGLWLGLLPYATHSFVEIPLEPGDKTADITEACFVQPGVVKLVGVGQRENPEAGITWTWKPVDIPDGIKAIAGECDLLIVIGEKKRPEILLFSVAR